MTSSCDWGLRSPPVGHTCVLKLNTLSFLHLPPSCFHLSSPSWSGWRVCLEVWSSGAWHRSPGWGRVPVLWTSRVTASPLASVSSCGGQIGASGFKAPPSTAIVQTPSLQPKTAGLCGAPKWLERLQWLAAMIPCTAHPSHWLIMTMINHMWDFTARLSHEIRAEVWTPTSQAGVQFFRHSKMKKKARKVTRTAHRRGRSLHVPWYFSS